MSEITPTDFDEVLHRPGTARSALASRDFRLLAEEIDQLPPIGQASGRIQFFMGRMLHPGH